MIFYDYYADVPEDVLQKFVTNQQLGRLVTADTTGQPHIGIYPFLFCGSCIEMHLHRSDEQLADLRANPKCSFEVDEIHGTIPSHWIHESNAAFATAYYRSVIFECEAIISEDLAVLASQQQRLMQQHQPDGGFTPVSAEHTMYAGSLSAIAALSLTVVRRKVKWKLAQNRDRPAREKIIRNLQDRGHPGDAEAANALQWTLDHDASK